MSHYSHVPPAADGANFLANLDLSPPETPSPQHRLSKNIQRRDPKDALKDFEFIGRKLSNVCLNTTSINQWEDPQIPFSPESLKLAFQSNVTEYKLNAIRQLRKYLCEDDIYDKIDQVLKYGFLDLIIQSLDATVPYTVQYESCWCLTNICAGSTEQTKTVMDAHALPSLLQLLQSPSNDVRCQSAWTIGNIAGDCCGMRDLILDMNSVPYLLQSVELTQTKEEYKKTAHIVVWVIANLCRWKKFDWSKLQPVFPFLCNIMLNTEDAEIISEASWALSRIFSGRNGDLSGHIQPELTERLVQLLGHSHIAILIPVIRTITNILSGEDDEPCHLLIKSGLLPALKIHLENGSTQVQYEAMLCLSNVTAGTIEHIQNVIDSKLLPVLIDCLRVHPDFKIRREACWTLANAVVPKDPIQVSSMVAQGLLLALFDFLQDYETLGNDLQSAWKGMQCMVNVLESNRDHVIQVKSRPGCMHVLEEWYNKTSNTKGYGHKVKELIEYAVDRWFKGLLSKEYDHVLDELSKVHLV